MMPKVHRAAAGFSPPLPAELLPRGEVDNLAEVYHSAFNWVLTAVVNHPQYLTIGILRFVVADKPVSEYYQ